MPTAPASPPAKRAHLLLALLPAVLVVAAVSAAARPSGPAAPPAAAASDTLVEPFVVRSTPRLVNGRRIGVLDVTLEMVVNTFRVPTFRVVVTRADTVGTTINVLAADTFRVDTLRLRAYRLAAVDGIAINQAPRFPGPTFRVSPGDSVRIKLVNTLRPDTPPTDSTNGCMRYPAARAGIDTAPDCFHGANFTNLHFHGMHVTPASNGDDVLLEVNPGSSHQYAFRIPQNQSPGTHWYHPHKHGSVALQVVNGMSGALVVEGGGLDSLTRVSRIRERLIALQQVDSTMNLVDVNAVKVSLVNGQYRPIIRMRPGEVQRWRIVNENITATTQFQIGFVDLAGKDEPTMYDIARDGVQYAPGNYDARNPDTSVLMAPGNRLDMFVKAPTALGRHLLTARVASSPNRRSLLKGTPPPDTLFYVEVVPGTAPATVLPKALPQLPRFLWNLKGTLDSTALKRDTAAAVIVFNDSLFPQRTPPGNPARFYLGNAANHFMRFDPESTYVPATAAGRPVPMVLDSTQTWKVYNYGQATNHPFHIHINPFQVLYVSAPNATDPNAALYRQLNTAAQSGSPIWLDVLALPLPVTSGGTVTQPGYIIVRQEYARFEGCPSCGSPTGWFVMHCHILGHEERGMMQVLEIVPPGGKPSPPPALSASGQSAHSRH
ncbi:MAG TPA: multicopper oxidase family protein [Longimicrobiaceae bacterium]